MSSAAPPKSVAMGLAAAALLLLLHGLATEIHHGLRRFFGEPACFAAFPTPTEDGEAVGMLFGEKLNLNRAQARDLQTLPDLGPVLAHRILEERRIHGPFQALSALQGVKGLGPAKLRALQNRLTVD
jgi:hypothetical protein